LFKASLKFFNTLNNSGADAINRALAIDTHEAIDDAKLKAKKIAKQLGVDLVRIVSFGEGGGQAPRYDYAMKTMAMDEAGGGELPNIETGENKIEVNVSIGYEIQ